MEGAQPGPGGHHHHGGDLGVKTGEKLLSDMFMLSFSIIIYVIVLQYGIVWLVLLHDQGEVCQQPVTFKSGSSEVPQGVSDLSVRSPKSQPDLQSI